MRYSGDAYYDENSLMDLKVVSTLGLTSEDEDALREIDGIEDAEGAYFTDVTCGENEKQTVLHIESLTKTGEPADSYRGKTAAEIWRTVS